MMMKDVDHTNPGASESIETVFRRGCRGTAIVADGGREDDEETVQDVTISEEAVQNETMQDVEHESPTEGASRSFERGTEGRDERV